MSFWKPTVFIFFLLAIGANLFAQKDSTAKKNNAAKSDSTTKKITENARPKKEKVNIFVIDKSKPYSPKVAILRSAILPGWGQATNKKIWKIPIVYGALGTTAYVFLYNVKQFKQANAAYKNAIDGDPTNDSLIPEPYYSVRSDPSRIQSFRNSVRQNVDYSVLFFLAFWGLNVVDATVDAHLKTFDVSDKLSLQLKPGYSPMAKTNGISLVLDIHKARPKLLPSTLFLQQYTNTK